MVKEKRTWEQMHGLEKATAMKAEWAARRINKPQVILPEKTILLSFCDALISEYREAKRNVIDITEQHRNLEVLGNRITQITCYKTKKHYVQTLIRRIHNPIKNKSLHKLVGWDNSIFYFLGNINDFYTFQDSLIFIIKTNEDLKKFLSPEKIQLLIELISNNKY